MGAGVVKPSKFRSYTNQADLRAQGSRAEAKTLVPMRPITSRTAPETVFNVVFVSMLTSLVTTNGFINHLCAPVRSTTNRNATPKLNHVQGIEPRHPVSLNPQVSSSVSSTVRNTRNGLHAVRLGE